MKKVLSQLQLCKVGFTLAEVLITLGVIGVVSAITIPTLINKHKEQVTVNKVKKLYSVFSQAGLMSINENGYPSEWDIKNEDVTLQNTNLAKYLKPYLKIAKDCGIENDCLGYNGQTVKRLNGKEIGNFIENSYKIVLSDGTFVFITQSKINENCANDGEICGFINADLNGKKAPNTIGIDIFRIAQINSKGIGIPQNNADCRLNSNGWSCGTYILLNGNIDYLKQ